MSQSLSQLLKAHQQKQSDSKRDHERLRRDAIQATQTLTDTLSDHVNDGVLHVITKQKELEQESTKLSTQTSRFAKQTTQWLTLVDEFNDALKELGDVRNWAEIMEHDMRTIMATLEFVHQGTSESQTIATRSAAET